MARAPRGYVQLKGSERRPAPGSKLVGPVDPNERFSVIICVRRRSDGPPMPDHDYYAKTPPSQRRRLSQAEFAAKYGASPDDIVAVTRFATAAGLAIAETNAVRRSVTVSGTVAQMEKAFGVTLGRYEVLARRAHRETRARPCGRGHRNLSRARRFCPRPSRACRRGHRCVRSGQPQHHAQQHVWRSPEHIKAHGAGGRQPLSFSDHHCHELDDSDCLLGHLYQWGWR